MNYNEDVFAPDKETVLMMEPDLIFSWGSLFSEKNLGDQTEWIANGTNTYISINTRRGGSRVLENEYTDLINIGKIFNVEDKAQAIVNEMKNEIASVLSQTEGQEAPREPLTPAFIQEVYEVDAKVMTGGDGALHILFHPGAGRKESVRRRKSPS